MSIPPGICGTGTKLDPSTQKCVPDEQQILTQLIDQDYVQYIDDEIIFVPGYDPGTPKPPLPPWFINWVDIGAYSCQTQITHGVCSIPGNNCHAPCRCADCAGWRGGNVTDCNGQALGDASTGRVWCNLEPGDSFSFQGEPDRCECAAGYCAVNGLCVSPYKHSANNSSKLVEDSNLCCPECSWKSPNETGGCAGATKCNPHIKCEESKVEYPGNKIFNPDFTKSNVTLIDQKCVNGDDNAEGICWHPGQTDARFRSGYVIVAPGQGESFSSLCPELDNSAAGQNEYECAIKCGDRVSGDSGGEYNTVNSQLECSRRCLPKLWRWFPVFEKLSTGELVFRDGYFQGEELMRYLPSEVDVNYCPQGVCEVSLNLPDFTEFNNCVECTECKWMFSPYENNNGFQDRKYECNKCKKCILDQISEGGQTYQVECDNMENCNTCNDIGANLTLVSGLSQNECDTCLSKGSGDSGCKVTTKDPYRFANNNYDFHAGAQKYNHGGDPRVTGTQSGYDPYTRGSGCDFGLVEGNPNCGNAIDGNMGYGDGCFDTPSDCTEFCDINWQTC